MMREAGVSRLLYLKQGGRPHPALSLRERVLLPGDESLSHRERVRVRATSL
jgi:hypothetical protein